MKRRQTTIRLPDDLAAAAEAAARVGGTCPVIEHDHGYRAARDDDGPNQ